MNNYWSSINKAILESKKNIKVYDGDNIAGKEICKKMYIPTDSVLGSVVYNVKSIYIDKWVIILGQNDKTGIMNFNLIDDICKNGMFIVAADVVGGIFAININRYAEGKNNIWYFAPDTLEWEDMKISYAEYISWLINGDIDSFYESFRWSNWQEDVVDLEFGQGILVYPFFWAKECEIETASKKKVPIEELVKLNFEYRKKITDEIYSRQ